MPAKSKVEMVDVTLDNVEDTGFFCFMSKRKSKGYQSKLSWFKDRCSEGMRIKMLPLPQRGFIEYIPGQHAWRSVHADDYMMIHCLWVVGKSKSQGYGRLLLQTCVDDAKRLGMKGVAAVTSEKVWMSSRKIFEAEGFELARETEPAFSLMVKRFGDHRVPTFAGDWEAKARRCGDGMTILHADQCPYIPDAVSLAAEAAAEAGVRFSEVRLTTRAELMERSPSPYGVFGVVLDGKLHSYHYLTKKDLDRVFGSRG